MWTTKIKYVSCLFVFFYKLIFKWLQNIIQLWRCIGFRILFFLSEGIFTQFYFLRSFVIRWYSDDFIFALHFRYLFLVGLLSKKTKKSIETYIYYKPQALSWTVSGIGGGEGSPYDFLFRVAIGTTYNFQFNIQRRTQGGVKWLKPPPIACIYLFFYVSYYQYYLWL